MDYITCRRAQRSSGRKPGGSTFAHCRARGETRSWRESGDDHGARQRRGGVLGRGGQLAAAAVGRGNRRDLGVGADATMARGTEEERPAGGLVVEGALQAYADQERAAHGHVEPPAAQVRPAEVRIAQVDQREVDACQVHPPQVGAAEVAGAQQAHPSRAPAPYCDDGSQSRCEKTAESSKRSPGRTFTSQQSRPAATFAPAGRGDRRWIVVSWTASIGRKVVKPGSHSAVPG